MWSARTAAARTRTTGDADGFASTRPLASPEEASAPEGSRLEVCPPSLFGEADAHPRSRFGAWMPTLDSLRGWLATGWMNSNQATDTVPFRDSLTSASDPASVRAARQAFVDALADVTSPRANDLARRAVNAATLRELWHLRNELFTMVSIAHCESVGHARLAELNRFFPVRSQGSTPRRTWPFPASPRHDAARGIEP